MSFVYEVNLAVNHQHADDFAKWLEPHIQEMLTFEGFISAQWFSRKPEDEQSDLKATLWTIHYTLQDAAAFEMYLNTHASRMRAEGMSLFQGAFTANRRLLYSQQRFVKPL